MSVFRCPDRLDRLPLCGHPDVTVAFEHGPAHVAGDRQHGCARVSRFREFGESGVPQVVKAAGDAGRTAQSLPRCLDGCGGACRILRCWLAERKHVPGRADLPKPLRVPGAVCVKNYKQLVLVTPALPSQHADRLEMLGIKVLSYSTAGDEIAFDESSIAAAVDL